MVFEGGTKKGMKDREGSNPARFPGKIGSDPIWSFPFREWFQFGVSKRTFRGATQAGTPNFSRLSHGPRCPNFMSEAARTKHDHHLIIIIRLIFSPKKKIFFCILLVSHALTLAPLHGRIGPSHASAASNWSISSGNTACSECSCRMAVSA